VRLSTQATPLRRGAANPLKRLVFFAWDLPQIGAQQIGMFELFLLYHFDRACYFPPRSLIQQILSLETTMIRINLLALALCSAAFPAYGAAKPPTAKKIFRQTLEGEDGQALYALLNLPVASGGGINRKFLASPEGTLRIDCRQAISGQSACAIELAADEEDGATAMVAGASAKAVWDALNLPVYSGRLADSKVYSDREQKVGIHCYHSAIPNGSPFSCALEVSN
jgi:hypothetical protein